MTPISYAVPTEKTSPRFCRAFAEGCGGTVADDGGLRPGPVALFGSPALWDLLSQARAEGRDWWYGDHGYFGRGEYFRVTRGDLQHDGWGDAQPDRFASFGLSIKPWRTEGGHILLCPPDDLFAGLLGFSGAAWAENVAAELRRHTDRPIRTRARGQANSRPLSADLKGCWALVTHSSNAAVEAAMDGVHVFCTAPCAGLALGTGDLSRIEAPERPLRELVLWKLAENQWTLDEISHGSCWEAIGRE
jgi:hypothetical protein